MGVTTRRVAMLIVVALNIFLVSHAALSASIEEVQIDRGLMDSIMNLVPTTTEAPFNPIQSLMDRLIKLKNILQLILNPTPGNLMSVMGRKAQLEKERGIIDSIFGSATTTTTTTTTSDDSPLSLLDTVTKLLEELLSKFEL